MFFFENDTQTVFAMGYFTRNKYNDNKLAEEFDLIVLTSNALANEGLPQGSLGVLTYSYTGLHPLYAEFALADGSKKEEKIDLEGFRVLNIKSKEDLSIVYGFLQQRARKKA